MSGHTHIHTYTRDNYSNPRCACAPRVNYIKQEYNITGSTVSIYTESETAVNSAITGCIMLKQMFY